MSFLVIFYTTPTPLTAIIFDKIKSNHNFNQTYILYEPTTGKVIFSKSFFSNHNHKNKYTQSCFYPKHLENILEFMAMKNIKTHIKTRNSPDTKKYLKLRYDFLGVFKMKNT